MTPDELFLLDLRNERMRNDRNSQTAAFAKHAANLDVINRLRSVKLLPRHLDDPQYIKIILAGTWRIDVTLDDLPKLRTVFSQVKDKGEYEVASAKDGTIAVQLDLGIPHNTCIVRYVKPLPPESRCKIVTETYASSMLVCDVSP